MGFGYRKSFRMGPFRITASKSGISYSAGVKGARITKRANGRVQSTLSVPGTGLRYTSKGRGKSQTAGRRARQQAPAPVAQPAPGYVPGTGSGQPAGDQLAMLRTLYQQGVLTRAEYQAAKNRLPRP